MKFKVNTLIKRPFGVVALNFGEDLFRYLTRGFPKVAILNYEGNEIGKKVQLRISAPFYSFKWVSVIESAEQTETKYAFTDVGETLPVGMKSWKHIHSIAKLDESSCIITDQVTFHASNWAWECLYGMVFIPQFYFRKSKYKHYFNKLLYGN